MPITPSLFVGEPDDVGFLHDLVWANTTLQAVKLIKDGRSALIAHRDGWKQRCRDILGFLGAAPEQIDWVMHWFAEVPG
jgi:hypothetical protein